MIDSTPRRRIGRPAEPDQAAPSPGPAALVPWVDLEHSHATVVYTIDRRQMGLIEVSSGWRMSDVLNEDPRVLLTRVAVMPHAGGLPGRAQEVSLPRETVYLAHLAGPRGDRELYRATVRTPIGLKLGPYLVRGYHHTLPGAQSLLAWQREREMVPLTDAWIEYPMRARRVRIPVEAVAVNRLLVDWVTVAPYDEFDPPY